jgi:Tfp pilus assembly protein PilX
MREQKGIILVTVLGVILLLSIFAMTGFIISTSELRVASIDKTAKRSFYISDAGIEEGRGRMQSTSSNLITDPSPNDPGWKVFIGPQDRVTDLGYNSSYTRYDRLTSLDYAVSVTHKVNSSNQVLYWGDSNLDGIPEVNTSGVGNPIYVITSNGKDLNASKTIQMESIYIPRITVVSALYSGGSTSIQGSSVLITGMNQCEGGSVAGITSTGSIVQPVGPVIDGVPPLAPYSSTMLNVAEMISIYKSRADYKRNYSSGQTMTGMNWGTPLLSDPSLPSSCSDKKVVYFNMNGHELTLIGGTTGCGTLLVDGDLGVYDGLTWNGLILVKGSVELRGSGEKNITGVIISGAGSSFDATLGSISILYCGQAISRQTQGLPMVVTKWTDLFGGS